MPRCEFCKERIVPKRRGRPRRFCSDLCRKRARRAKSEVRRSERKDAERRRRERGVPQRVRWGTDKEAARKAVGRAVERGELTRGPCEVGDDCDGPVQAHHDDYSRPLDVRWLCRRHHNLEHRRKRVSSR